MQNVNLRKENTKMKNNIAETEKNENLEEIKKDNKKAKKSFVKVCVIGFFVGMAASFGMLAVSRLGSAESIVEKAAEIFAVGAPAVMLLLTVVTTIIASAANGKARRMIKAWDGEDEETIEAIEKKLNTAPVLGNMNMICAYFLGMSSFAADSFFLDRARPAWAPEWLGGANLAVWFVGFIGAMIATTVVQKNTVDLEREINPEKKGSVYDTKFAKTWEESCDEAEKLKIYKSSFKAFKATSAACVAVLVGLFFINVVYNTGIMPILAVCIVWAVQNIAYFIEACKD